jgi:aminomethyltransferase
MGRLHFTGKDALKLLDTVCTRKLVDAVVGQSRYSLVCNESGGIMDDVIVSRDAKHWLMVCNASNRDKIVAHLKAVRSRLDLDCDIADQTESTAMIAVQGPKVLEKLAGVLPEDPREIKRYHFVTANLILMKVGVYRSGYTGEDGVELILPKTAAAMAMKMLAGSLNKENATIAPAGLGARDTLRTEAGMPLYGHELTEQIDPISAGLGWAVDLTKPFIGQAAVKAVADAGPKRKLVGLEIVGQRIARQGSIVMSGGSAVGEITSGTLSPTLGKSIAMAYVDAGLTAVGTQLSVDLKGSMVEASVVKLPFYKRPV